MQKQPSRKLSSASVNLAAEKLSPGRRRSSADVSANPAGEGSVPGSAVGSLSKRGSGEADGSRGVKKGLAQSLNGMARLFSGRKSGEVQA